MRLLSATLFSTALMIANSSVFAQESVSPQYNLIEVQANASRYVVNDEAQAILFIEKTEKSPTELANQVAKLMNFAATSAKKYPTVQFKTGQQNTSPVYDENNQKIKSWRAHASIQLKSQDLESMSKLIAELQQHFQLNQINLNVSDRQRKQVENELMVEAIQQFQSRAKMISQAWHKSDYDLVHMNINLDHTSEYYPVAMMRADTFRAKSSVAVESQEIQMGESKISLNVQGSIQLK